MSRKPLKATRGDNPVKARDKVALKKTRDGLVEHNATTGEDIRVSKREAELDLRAAKSEHEGYSQLGNTPHASKKKQRRKQSYRDSKADTAVEGSKTIAPDDVQPAPQSLEDTPKSIEPDVYQEDAPDSDAPLSTSTPDSRQSPEAPNIEPPSSERRKRQKKAEYAATTDAGEPVEETPQPDTPPKLQFSPEEVVTDTPKIHHNRKLSKAQQQAERAVTKLETAKAKLPTKKKLRAGRMFNEKSEKPKRRLYFETEVKSQHEHLKGPLPLRPVKAAGNSALAFGHRKMYQVQHENVGTEAAHKGEMMAEGGVRAALRFRKTAPYRKVQKLERKAAKKSINLTYQQTLADNPKLNSNLLSRAWQKRKIKKEYAKAAREAQKTAGRAQKAGEATERAAKAVAGVVRRHPVATTVIVLIALLMFTLVSLIGAFGSMGSGGLGGILSASYLAEDTDIENAELAYTEWETDLQMQIAGVESSHAGYDEYRYSIGDISHNPYELMAYLTVAYQNFSYNGLEPDLRALFAEQYTLTLTPTTETRYADPNDADNDGDYEPYEWKILTVTLTARSFTDVAASHMSGDQLVLYALLLQTKGSRQYLGNPFGDTNWLTHVTSNYGYRIHPISGEKNLHRGVDIGFPTGTEILAGQDGTVTFAGVSGGYGNVVIIENDKGLMSKYAHCDTLLVSTGQAVSMGDVIATVGNTGNSTGPHLHLEVLINGEYLNPLYFADTGSFGEGPVYGNAGAPMGDGSYAALIAEAEKYLGYPYVYGGSSPSTSFDCSGLVCFVINQSGVGSVGRTTAQGLYNLCTPVLASEAQPGDLVFFHSTYSHYEHITHVAIYCGNGKMFHAGNPIGYASLDTAYWQSHLYAFGRIVND